MAILITCPSCGTQLKAPDRVTGGLVKCAICGRKFRVSPGTWPPPNQPPGEPDREGNEPEAQPPAPGGISTPAVVLILGAAEIVASGLLGPAFVLKGHLVPRTNELQQPQTAPPIIRSEGSKANESRRGKSSRPNPPRFARQKEPAPQNPEQAGDLARAIQKAAVLQAPPLVKGKHADLDRFDQQMRELAGNEFKFRSAKGTVFCSTFNQNDAALRSLGSIARNTVLQSGNYNFDTGEYILSPVFWYEHYKETVALGRLLPETTDSCMLQMRIKVDTKTAEGWQEAMERRTFSLTAWYRLTRVEQATWNANPHWTDGRLAHAIAFAVEVLRFEDAPEGGRPLP